jgi:hypothetical protein
MGTSQSESKNERNVGFEQLLLTHQKEENFLAMQFMDSTANNSETNSPGLEPSNTLRDPDF